MKNSKKVTSQDVKQSIVAITSVDKKVAQKLELAYKGAEAKKWVSAFQLGKCLDGHKERMNKDKKSFEQFAKDHGCENKWHYYVTIGLGLGIKPKTCDDFIRMYNRLKGDKKTVSVADMKAFVEAYALTRSDCKVGTFWNTRTIDNYIKNGMSHVDTSQDVKRKKTPKTTPKKAPKANQSISEVMANAVDNNKDVIDESICHMESELRMLCERVDPKLAIEKMEKMIRNLKANHGIK
jgi:hypothetical protein